MERSLNCSSSQAYLTLKEGPQISEISAFQNTHTHTSGSRFLPKITDRDSIKEHDRCHLCGKRQTLTISLLPVLKFSFLGLFSLHWWNSGNGDTINLHKNGITYGVTDDFARRLGLNQRIVLFGCLLRDPDK